MTDPYRKRNLSYSTGRGARVKHSTAMEWDELERLRNSKKRRSRIQYSTGEMAAILHATGTQFDGRFEEESLSDGGGTGEDEE